VTLLKTLQNTGSTPTPLVPAKAETQETAAFIAQPLAPTPTSAETPVLESPAAVASIIPAASDTTAGSTSAATPPHPGPAPTALQRAVMVTVQSWAEAWAKQDADRFLSFYAEEFSPQDSPSRREWEQSRRESITAPKQIKLRLNKLELTMIGEQRAQVRFQQVVESDNSYSNVNRTMILQNVAGNWLIVQEQSS
jgi:ketosteroid isomerase-like protein